MRALPNAKEEITLTQAALQLHVAYHGARTRRAAQMAGTTPSKRSSVLAVAADLAIDRHPTGRRATSCDVAVVT
jgi:hypothetical protein